MSGTWSIKGSRYEWNALKFSNAFPAKFVHFWLPANALCTKSSNDKDTAGVRVEVIYLCGW